jgi:drug/metabolite transporter (DMT)-like permease
MTPLFTIGLSAVLLKTRCSLNKWLSLVPVVVGVALARVAFSSYHSLYDV